MPCTSCFYGKWVEDVCTSQFAVFVYLVLRCLLAAAPGLVAVLPMWDSSYVSGTVFTSQAIGFPLAHGKRVVPSGRLLSSRIRLIGSLTLTYYYYYYLLWNSYISAHPNKRIYLNRWDIIRLRKSQWDHHARFREDRSNRCRDIAIFVIFKMAAVAIFDFQKFEILTTCLLPGANVRYLAKFYQNRSNGCVDMAIQRFSKMAPVRHLGLVGCVLGPLTMSIWWF